MCVRVCVCVCVCAVNVYVCMCVLVCSVHNVLPVLKLYIYKFTSVLHSREMHTDCQPRICKGKYMHCV